MSSPKSKRVGNARASRTFIRTSAGRMVNSWRDAGCREEEGGGRMEPGLDAPSRNGIVNWRAGLVTAADDC